MTNRRAAYLQIVAACENQSTGWLTRCHAEPSPDRGPLSRIARLAVRSVLRSRLPSMPVDVSYIFENGMAQKLSNSVRCF